MREVLTGLVLVFLSVFSWTGLFYLVDRYHTVGAQNMDVWSPAVEEVTAEVLRVQIRNTTECWGEKTFVIDGQELFTHPLNYTKVKVGVRGKRLTVCTQEKTKKFDRVFVLCETAKDVCNPGNYRLKLTPYDFSWGYAHFDLYIPQGLIHHDHEAIPYEHEHPHEHEVHHDHDDDSDSDSDKCKSSGTGCD